MTTRPQGDALRGSLDLLLLETLSLEPIHRLIAVGRRALEQELGS